jgi:hypothetical protein
MEGALKPVLINPDVLGTTSLGDYNLASKTEVSYWSGSH